MHLGNLLGMLGKRTPHYDLIFQDIMEVGEAEGMKRRYTRKVFGRLGTVGYSRYKKHVLSISTNIITNHLLFCLLG